MLYLICWSISSQIARLSVWKRFADITYQLPGGALNQVSNVSPRTSSEPIQSEAYFQLYDRLFPHREGDDLQRALLTHITSDLAREFYSGVRVMREMRIGVVLLSLPWLLQRMVVTQTGWQLTDVAEENRINATFLPECLQGSTRCPLVLHIFNFQSFHSRVVSTRVVSSSAISDLAELCYRLSPISISRRNSVVMRWGSRRKTMYFLNWQMSVQQR